jgi:GTP 3',8-cyclase
VIKVRASSDSAGGAITYRFSSPAIPSKTLYVNLIARYGCVNDCVFCSRPRDESELGKPNFYEAGAGVSLYLPKSPSTREVMDSISANILEDDKELAFVGAGEPLIYLPKVCDIIKGVKKKHKVRVRIDTNGAVKLMFPNPARALAKAGLDEIRISVNALTKDEYNAMCRPSLAGTYKSTLSFVKDCISEGIETKVSFLWGYHQAGLPLRSRRDYLLFAQGLGLKEENVILRQYHPPLQ